MVTETWPHHQQDSLESTWQFITKFRNKRRWRSKDLAKYVSYSKILNKFGIDRIVACYDTTYTFANGWNHHMHSIYITKNDLLPIKKLEYYLKKNFLNESIKARKTNPERYKSASLEGIWRNGLKCSRTKNPEYYIYKMGMKKYIQDKYSVSEEIVGANSKKASSKNPWLLENKEKLWEYISTSKGKRLMMCSPRNFSKKILGELTDEQIIQLSPENTKLVCEIPEKEWRSEHRDNIQSLIDKFNIKIEHT